MKVLYAIPIFLDYRIPLFKRLDKLFNGEFNVLYSPKRYQNRFPKVLDKMYGIGIPLGWRKFKEDDEAVFEAVKMANDHGIEAWGYHADNREAAERAIKFGFTNITANAPEELIAYLDEIGRRVGK